jgi:hypothetical protein
VTTRSGKRVAQLNFLRLHGGVFVGTISLVDFRSQPYIPNTG